MRANISLTPRQLARAMGAVALGGAVGTAARDLLLKVQNIPSATNIVDDGLTGSPHHVAWTSQVPWTLLAINTVGVYVATYLLRGPLRQHDPNDLTRLLVITGLLGGFTSYSGLFVSLASIWHVSVVAGLLVGVAAVLSGVLAAGLGLRGHHRR